MEHLRGWFVITIQVWLVLHVDAYCLKEFAFFMRMTKKVAKFSQNYL